jgi:hypothetical protein
VGKAHGLQRQKGSVAHFARLVLSKDLPNIAIRRISRRISPANVLSGATGRRTTKRYGFVTRITK